MASSRGPRRSPRPTRDAGSANPACCHMFPGSSCNKRLSNCRFILSAYRMTLWQSRPPHHPPERTRVAAKRFFRASKWSSRTPWRPRRRRPTSKSTCCSKVPCRYNEPWNFRERQAKAVCRSQAFSRPFADRAVRRCPKFRRRSCGLAFWSRVKLASQCGSRPSGLFVKLFCVEMPGLPSSPP